MTDQDSFDARHGQHHPRPKVEDLLQLILHKVNHIMADLTTLTAAVAANRTVSDSAVTLLQGLKVALDAAIAADDPVALEALSTDLGAQTTALAAAVTANTPVAPAAR